MSGIPGSFNVSSTAGILGSYLSPTNATGLFAAFNASNSNPTTAALESGKLTQTQYKVIQAVAATGNKGYDIPFTASGKEPSTIANIRSYGWLKLNGKSYDSKTKTYVGNYTLTKIGQAIYNRTNGGKVGTNASASTLSSVDLNGGSAAASATAALSSEVGALAGALSSFGVNVTA